jgi:hypothetical protein
MIKSLENQFSEQLVGHHKLVHNDLDFSTWLDSLDLTGNIHIDEALMVHHRKSHDSFYLDASSFNTEKNAAFDS